jgi:exodeoxyribonuclease V alpha subunit
MRSPKPWVRDIAQRASPARRKLLDVPREVISTALDLELQDGTVVADRALCFSGSLARAERVIAERLTRLANGRLPWHWIDPIKVLFGIV